MTAQELKNSILQLAVQGKLVPQSAEDEPVEELLKQIAQQKEQLIKDEIIKKEKPLPNIVDEEIPFDIPDNWLWVRLGDYCLDVFSGKSPVYSKVPSPYEVIGQAANQQAGLDYSQVKYTVPEFWNSMDLKYFLRENDVLLNTLGHGTLGRSGIVPPLERKLLTDGHLFVFRLCSATASKYFYYYLQYKRSEIEKSANGSTNQTFLSLKRTNQWLVPIPPLAEQKRIVAKIEELLPLVAKYDEAEQKLSTLNADFPEMLRKSILQQAVQGKLTERSPSDEPASELLKRIQTEKAKLITEGKIKKEKALLPIAEDDCPFEIPGTWKWVKLGEIADLCLGKMLDKAKNQGNLHPYLRNVNVRWGFFDFEDILKMRFKDDEEERYSVKYGDLVVCEGGEPGRCAVWTDVSQTFRIQKALHRVRFIGDVDSFYAYRVFEYYASNGYFAKRFTGETIKHLPGEVLKNIAFPLPPIAEQKRIVVRINELLAICDGLKHVR